MANTTRKAIIRKLGRVPDSLETAQSHVIDCMSRYMELVETELTLQDFIDQTEASKDFRYINQMNGLLTMMQVLESAKEFSIELTDHIKKM